MKLLKKIKFLKQNDVALMFYTRAIFILCMFYGVSFVNSSIIVPIQLAENDITNISNGIGNVTCNNNIIKGTEEIIEGLLDVVDWTCINSGMTYKEQKELNDLFWQFKSELILITRINKKDDQGKKDDLADSISRLIFHLLNLMVIRTNIKYHLKNILASLLDIISFILKSEEKNKEIEALEESIQNILEKNNEKNKARRQS